MNITQRVMTIAVAIAATSSFAAGSTTAPLTPQQLIDQVKAQQAADTSSPPLFAPVPAPPSSVSSLLPAPRTAAAPADNG